MIHIIVSNITRARIFTPSQYIVYFVVTEQRVTYKQQTGRDLMCFFLFTEETVYRYPTKQFDQRFRAEARRRGQDYSLSSRSFDLARPGVAPPTEPTRDADALLGGYYACVVTCSLRHSHASRGGNFFDMGANNCS